MAEASVVAADAGPARARIFASLEIPDYRRFYIGQGVSLIGTWLQSAAVNWIVFDLTRSTRMLGIVEMASVMPGLLVGLLAGAVADRAAPRAMVLAMQACQMVLAFSLAALVGFDAVRIWQMALILALTRVCVTFEMPSRQVFLYDLVGPEVLPNAIALNSGLFNASRVVGPALAGVCLAWVGRTACFVLNGVSFWAAILALVAIGARSRPRTRPRHEPGAAVLFGGIAHLRRDPRLAALFALIAFFGVIGMGYMAMIPAYTRLVLGAGSSAYSALLACGGLGATAGALSIAGQGGRGRCEHAIVRGMVLFALALGAAATLPPLARSSGLVSSVGVVATAAVCLFGAGFGGIVFYASAQTLIQATVPDHLRGRIMGVWMIVFSGSVPLGALWTGELAGRRGIAEVLAVSAGLVAVAAGLVASMGLLAPRSRGAGAGPSPQLHAESAQRAHTVARES